MYLTISLKEILLGVFIHVSSSKLNLYGLYNMVNLLYACVCLLGLTSAKSFFRYIIDIFELILRLIWHIILFAILGLLTSDGIMWCLMHFKLWPASSILIMCSLGSAFQSSEILGSLTGALSEYIYVMFESSLTAHQRLIRTN